MHNHPKLVTADTLATRAAPDETQAVRVILKNVMNHRGFTLHGKSTHRYLFKLNPAENAHALDVPVSVWMEKKQWLARDLMGNPFVKDLLVFVVPWEDPRNRVKPEIIQPLAEPIADDQTAEDLADAILAGAP